MLSPLRSRFRSAATLLALSLLPLAAKADDLATVLPGDVLVFGEMRSLPKLFESKDNPLVKKIHSGEFGKFLEKLMADEPEDAKYDEIFKDETGITDDEFLEKFTGGLAAGLSVPLDKLVAGKGDESDFGGLIVADFAGDEALFKKVLGAVHKIKDAVEEAEKKKEKEASKNDPSSDDEDEDAGDDDDDGNEKPQAEWPDQYEETTTEVDGAAVHEWALKDPEKTSGVKFSWAIADGRLILGLGETDTKEAVHRQMKKSSEGSLASDPVYKEIEGAAGDWDVLAGANLEKSLAAVQESLRLQMEKGELKPSLPVNPLQAWAGAGMDQFRAAFLSMDLQGQELAVHGSLTYAQKPAILKLYAATGPGQAPDFAPADAQEISWGTMDWGKMFDNLKELAVAVSPMAAGMIETGLTTAKTKIGVDVRKDLLGQMGDNLWTLSKISPADPKVDQAADDDEEDEFDPLNFGAQSQLIGVSLRDAKAFELSLKSVFNTLAPGKALFDDREYLGNTIHEVKGTPTGQKIAWLIKSDTLILSVGATELLEKALAGMEKKPAANPLEQDFVKGAFAKLPSEGQVSASYYDAGMLLDAWAQMMKGLVGTFASMEGEDGKFMETLNSLPDKLEIPIFLVARSYLSDKSFDFRLRLANKP